MSLSRPRDFSVYSPLWANHTERIADAWRERVQAQDIVLLLGDVSWASSVKRVLPDLHWVAGLPGRKVMIRGNHDRWWTKIDTVRTLLHPFGIQALQGDSITLEDVVICGAQGHIAPHDPYYEPDPPQNRYERELATLEAALAHAASQRRPDQALIVLMHYPPFTSDGQPTAYSELIEQHTPALCLYAHLHHEYEWRAAVQGTCRGVEYRLLSADFVDMMLQEIHPVKPNIA